MKHGLRDCFYLSAANADDWTENDPDTYWGRIVLLQRSLGFDPGTPYEMVHDKLIDMGREAEADELRELASGVL